MLVAGSSVVGSGGPGPLTCADLLGIRDLEGEEGGGGAGLSTCFISCGVYSMVRMIMTRSRRSRGMP